jgi:hypothetical protein
MTAPVIRRKPGTRNDPYGFQGAAAAQTQVAAEQAGYDFDQRIGALYGNLNAMGALRSGGASQGIQQAGRTFSQQVGNAAAANALQAESLGQDFGFRREALDKDYGFRQQELGERRRQFDTDLGFRTTTRDKDIDLERARMSRGDYRWQVERRDALEAAKAKRKSGLFGAIGSALGIVAGPAIGAIGNAVGKQVDSWLS